VYHRWPERARCQNPPAITDIDLHFTPAAHFIDHYHMPYPVPDRPRSGMLLLSRAEVLCLSVSSSTQQRLHQLGFQTFVLAIAVVCFYSSFVYSFQKDGNVSFGANGRHCSPNLSVLTMPSAALVQVRLRPRSDRHLPGSAGGSNSGKQLAKIHSQPRLEHTGQSLQSQLLPHAL
jgi:hypothetical protein